MNEQNFRSNTKFQVLSPSGWVDFAGVMFNGERDVYKVSLEDCVEVSATADHSFFSQGEKIQVSEMSEGTKLDTTAGDGMGTVVRVTPDGSRNVYDIVEVKDDKHRFIVNRSVVVANCDEFAAIGKNLAQEFFTSVQPTLATGGNCIITSTPKNDEDQFAQIWRGAKDNTDEYGNLTPDGVGKNGFFATEVPWWEHPDRDEAWAKPFRESLGEARFKQEFCNQFLSDDETLINPLTLQNLKGIDPKYYTGTVRWYNDIIPNHGYMVSLDPSLGTGADNAAIQVFQIPEMIQVAEWQHNRTTPRDQVRILLQTLWYIDDVLCESDEQEGVPEIFWTVENNSIGEALLLVIEDTGEERFPGNFVCERKRKGQVRRFRKGLTTGPRNKLSACARLKSLLESGRMQISSGNLIREFKNYVHVGQSFKAKSGEKDDLVAAVLLIVRMLDVVLMWGGQAGDLREHISDEEILSLQEPMPVTF